MPRDHHRQATAPTADHGTGPHGPDPTPPTDRIISPCRRNTTPTARSSACSKSVPDHLLDLVNTVAAEIDMLRARLERERETAAGLMSDRGRAE